MANNKLMEQLKKRYGNKNGTKIYLTIMPGILSDFKKVLAKSEVGETVTETYRFEDGDGAVVVTGSKDASGTFKIDAELTQVS